jgi:hypothetical protein
VITVVIDQYVRGSEEFLSKFVRIVRRKENANDRGKSGRKACYKKSNCLNGLARFETAAFDNRSGAFDRRSIPNGDYHAKVFLKDGIKTERITQLEAVDSFPKTGGAF